MYTKTSAFARGDYFENLHHSPKQSLMYHKTLNIKVQQSDSFWKFQHEVTLTLEQGIALLIMTNQPENPERYQEFVLQGTVKIHPNVCFNILTITDECAVTLASKTPIQPERIMSLYPLKVRDFTEQMRIDKVFGFFYQVKTSPYQYMNDTHDYYEMTIVDQGELEHDIDGQAIIARKHDCLLYFPNQQHSQRVKQEGVTTYLSILFQAHGIDESLKNQLIHLSSQQTHLIEKMVELSTKPHTPYFADEMILLFRQMILYMLRYENSQHAEPSTSMRENYESELFQTIIDYLHQHVEEHHQVQDLTVRFSLSRSTLQLLFKKYTNMTPKNYINHLRLKRSKILIKESKMSLSEIATELGYGSLQYFSRAFSQQYGISPSHYAKSLIK